MIGSKHVLIPVIIVLGFVLSIQAFHPSDFSTHTSAFGISINQVYGDYINLHRAYTWTDKVNITIYSPDSNSDPNLVDVIGDNSENQVIVSTRGHQIYYKLVETGPNTGIFAGYVILTGDSSIKGAGGVDGQGTQPRSITGNGSPDSCTNPSSPCGPTDGLLQAEDSDGLTVSFKLTRDQTITASAPIRWNVGQIKWSQPSYPADGQGLLQVFDPDMNLNPMVIDKFDTNVWSTSDSGGIKLTMIETGQDTGIFQGTVHFTTEFQSSGNRLHVTGGDTITGEYKDRTLPPPHTPADQISLTSTVTIGVADKILGNDLTAQISNLHAKNTIRQGDSLEFNIRAINNGDADANATLSISLTKGLRAGLLQSGCTATNDQVKCSYVNIPHNSFKDIILNVTVGKNATGTQVVTSTISSPVPDPDPSNNIARYNITVNPSTPLPPVGDKAPEFNQIVPFILASGTIMTILLTRNKIFSR